MAATWRVINYRSTWLGAQFRALNLVSKLSIDIDNDNKDEDKDEDSDNKPGLFRERFQSWMKIETNTHKDKRIDRRAGGQVDENERGPF